MLTRFFSHSKPIAFTIISILFTVAFFIENFLSKSVEVSTSFILNKIGLLAVFLFIIFLLNFMVKRNNIHKSNTYAVSIFVFLSIAFPELLRSSEFILSYLFLLLSMRKILSLKTNKNVKQKIFDSGFLLMISILFDPFHLLFLIFIYFGVIMYASQNYRHFIIPLFGIIVSFVMYTSFILIVENSFLNYSIYLPRFSNIENPFTNFKYSFLLSLSLLLLLWIIIQFPKIYSRSKLHVSESISLILVFLVVSLAVLLLNETSISVDIIYLIFPLSILIGNYFQLNSTKKWIKEVFYALMLGGIVFSAII
jgi:hypothetical protein